MTFTLIDVLFAAALALAALFWWNAQGAKQLALSATRNYCQQMDVQLLDDVVALRGLWWRRDDRGQVRLWRAYHFEFTATGNDRYTGKVMLLGNRVIGVQLAPHRLN